MTRGVLVGVILVILLVACGGGEASSKTAADAQSPGVCPKTESKQSYAEGALFDKVTDRVKAWHFEHYPDCMRARVLATQVQRKSADSSDELWVLEGCQGQCYHYKVRLKPAGQEYAIMVLNTD